MTSRWRIAAWAAAGSVLLLPALAMQVTDAVDWNAADFAVAGGLVLGVGALGELAARSTRDRAYRGGVAVALGAGLVLVWANLAVGVIGSEGNPANRLYGGVLAVGFGGAILARFRPGGMARALVAAAIAQMAVAGVALAAGLGRPATGPLELLGLNGAFAALWLASAWLFRKAARAGAGSEP